MSEKKRPVAIVFGGNGGLGTPVVSQLLGDDYTVVVASRSILNDRNMVDWMRVDPQLMLVACNICVAKEVEQVFSVAREHGTVRVVVNCAGIHRSDFSLDHTLDEYADSARDVWATNGRGSMLVAEAAMRCMSKNERANYRIENGVLIMVSSQSAQMNNVYDECQVGYAASKAYVEAVVKGYAKKGSVGGVRCVGIAPGVFATPMVGVKDGSLNRPLSHARFPHRMGDPSEFASMVKFVINNMYVNDTILELRAVR